MKIFAETERLILREIVVEDEEAFFELDSDPEVHRYLGNKPVKSIDEVRKMIAFVREQYIENGIGRWAVVEKATNNFIGWCGLKLFKEPANNYVNYYDLGYRLTRKYWGKGYATEAAKASLTYGFEKLNLPEIHAAAAVDNAASNKVIKKLGFKYTNSLVHFGTMHNWYIMTKREFI